MLGLHHWSETFQSLRRHKLRTVLTAFGVFWGVMLLVVLLGAGRGLENGVMRFFASNSHKMYVTGRTTSRSYGRKPSGRHIQFTMDDLTAVRREVKGVGPISPQKWSSSRAVCGARNGQFEVCGGLPEYTQKIEKFRLLCGRYFNELDE